MRAPKCSRKCLVASMRVRRAGTWPTCPPGGGSLEWGCEGLLPRYTAFTAVAATARPPLLSPQKEPEIP